ncbi:MAG: sigma-70 family RNA polymerase sigma factor [Saprospiraceae bacterium]|nr:sigma-70 family RNA polymerase sigma factor [Saprospiraceae bacterium]
MNITDDDIIQGCIKGKRSAQHKLYKKYAVLMLGICLRYSKNKSEAEDVLQDGFIKVFSNIKKFRSEGSFEGWIKRIMINTALVNARNNLKHYYHSDINELEQQISNGDEEHIKEAISSKDLMKLIQALPDGYRIVFNLYVFEKFSHKEISESLNISESTSKSQLSRARNLLRKSISEFIKKKSVA